MTTEQIYSTAQLIGFLKSEMSAIHAGQRQWIPSEEYRSNLEAALKTSNPVLLEKASEFGMAIDSYHDFRSQIHNYQRLHKVSGLEQQEISFNGHTASFYNPCDQLILLDSDLTLLQQQKPQAIAFFLQCVQDSNRTPYLPVSCFFKNGGDINVALDMDWLRHELGEPFYEWAILDIIGEELALMMGWGDPNDAPLRACPDSDSISFYLPAEGS